MFHSFHPWSCGGQKYLHSDLLGPPRSCEALHLDHWRIGSILITDHVGWALSQLLQIKLRMYTCTHSDLFFLSPPAELKLSLLKCFCSDISTIWLSTDRISSPRVVKQTSVCEKKGVWFLWVFIFHSCSVSFFLPVQTKMLCRRLILLNSKSCCYKFSFCALRSPVLPIFFFPTFTSAISKAPFPSENTQTSPSQGLFGVVMGL